MPRYTYASGYKTREAAEEALEDMFAHAEVSECERPRIESYMGWAHPIKGQPLEAERRFAITLCE